MDFNWGGNLLNSLITSLVRVAFFGATALGKALGLVWVVGTGTVWVHAEPVPLSYAENFSIDRYDTHSIVTVRNPWRGAGQKSFVYALVPRGKALPGLPATARLIRVPIQRLSLMETVYLSHVEALGLYEQLIGLAHVELASDERTRARVISGDTKRIQASGALDIESLMLLRSDAIFTSAMGNPQFDVHPQLERAGQPVVVTAEYMEAHPLGRSEWIKFTAAFFGMDYEAEALFDRISYRYNELLSLAQGLSDRPRVLANAPFGGVWHVPGGRSFTARSIADAGGEYVFSDDRSTGGVPKDFESVYLKAGKADVWLHPGTARTLDELFGVDERFQRFEAFGKGRIYNNTFRLGPGGLNEIWERAVLHPEEALADLIAILHPRLLPGHSFYYYEQLK